MEPTATARYGAASHSREDALPGRRTTGAEYRRRGRNLELFDFFSRILLDNPLPCAGSCRRSPRAARRGAGDARGLKPRLRGILKRLPLHPDPARGQHPPLPQPRPRHHHEPSEILLRGRYEPADGTRIKARLLRRNATHSRIVCPLKSITSRAPATTRSTAQPSTGCTKDTTRPTPFGRQDEHATSPSFRATPSHRQPAHRLTLPRWASAHSSHHNRHRRHRGALRDARRGRRPLRADALERPARPRERAALDIRGSPGAPTRVGHLLLAPGLIESVALERDEDSIPVVVARIATVYCPNQSNTNCSRVFGQGQEKYAQAPGWSWVVPGSLRPAVGSRSGCCLRGRSRGRRCRVRARAVARRFPALSTCMSGVFCRPRLPPARSVRALACGARTVTVGMPVSVQSKSATVAPASETANGRRESRRTSLVLFPFKLNITTLVATPRSRRPTRQFGPTTARSQGR